MTATTPRVTPPTAGHYIANRLNFTCNETLTGGYFKTGTGQLPEDRKNGFLRAQDADDFYAVYSYVTPIAWYAHGVWTVPNVRYSQTTSRHQNVVRKAVGL